MNPSITCKFFDGKLGVWALLTREPAKRSSRNGPTGTMVPYPVVVNKETYRNMLGEHVLPSIQAKFSGAVEGRRITVQQDNASPHIQPDYVPWRQAVNASGCEVHLRFQPQNSPGMNVLDLAVFNVLQSRQEQMAAHILDDLVANVKMALDELPPATLHAGFLTLQCVMDDCVAAGGDNTYKIRHMSKSKLAREGRLPRCIKCSATTASFLPALDRSPESGHSETSTSNFLHVQIPPTKLYSGTLLVPTLYYMCSEYKVLQMVDVEVYSRKRRVGRKCRATHASSMASGADTLWLNDADMTATNSSVTSSVPSTVTSSSSAAQRVLLPHAPYELSAFLAAAAAAGATAAPPPTFLDDLLRDDGDATQQTPGQSFPLLQSHDSSAMVDVGVLSDATFFSLGDDAQRVTTDSSSTGSPPTGASASRLLQLETNYERKKKRAKINRKDLNSRFQELMDILHLKEDRKLNRAKILEKTIEHIEKLTAELNALKAGHQPQQHGLQTASRKTAVAVHHQQQFRAIQTAMAHAIGQNSIASSANGSSAGGAPLLPYNPSQWSAAGVGASLPLAPMMWVPCPIVTPSGMVLKRAAPGRPGDSPSRKRGRVESVESAVTSSSEVESGPESTEDVTPVVSPMATKETSKFEWSAVEIPALLAFCDAWTLVTVMNTSRELRSAALLLNGKATVMQVVELFIVVQTLSHARIRVTDRISLSSKTAGNSSFEPFTASSGAHLTPQVVALNADHCATKDLSAVALQHGDLCVLSVYMACPGLELEDQFLQRYGN
ncbi:unnamed protein product [Phytophthora fragariaefolia]|uniref:Unnamed protein product n=1 Tax=Phytophthora fragariaefolia TaxID=1490495 RepID=A0A9W6Y526_9STRA|nr:unnamed protein product [Phytophthora fragariaefolia]